MNRISNSIFCTEEKLKKRIYDRLIGRIKTRDFVIEDIRADSIRDRVRMPPSQGEGGNSAHYCTLQHN